MRCDKLSLFTALPGVAHGFFGSTGGVSVGDYQSLNCSLINGDTHEAVMENRHCVRRSLGLGHLRTMNQVHGHDVISIFSEGNDNADSDRLPTDAVIGTADALITDQPGVGLGVLVADCVPVIFADRHERLVAVAHAGWKGALGGVIEAVLAQFDALAVPRSDVLAGLGASIQQASYQVDHGFKQAFIERSNIDASAFFIDDLGVSDKHLFDLPSYVMARLTNAGVIEVDRIACDTYRSDEHFSCRRALHAGQSEFGRQVCVIGLRPRLK